VRSLNVDGPDDTSRTGRSGTDGKWTDRQKRLVVIGLLSLLWLLPFFWVGSKLGPLPFRVPDRLWQQYMAAGLFTQRVDFWGDWRIQVKVTADGEWRDLPTNEVSTMATSGYRQRIDRILGDTRTKKVGARIRPRLAEQVARSRPEIVAVRFLHRAWPTNSPALTAPEGNWETGAKMAPQSVSLNVYGPYLVADGKVKATTSSSKSAGESKRPPSVFQRTTKPSND
jgi:hypothetical protein